MSRVATGGRLTMSRVAPLGRLVRIAGAVAGPAIAGLTLGLMLPRGPMTSWQSLGALALALVTGLVTGWLLQSRWAALLAPVVLAAVFEVTRLGAEGPTVDAIQLDGIYGIAALVAGRGFDGLVILLPLVVGTLWGAARTRPRREVSGRARVGLAVRRTGLGVATAVVAVLTLGIVRPAGTEPILDAAGEPVAGSVAELVTLRVGGTDQTMMIRGHDADAPVLLFLEGGPGGTAIGALRYAGGALEEQFVVATWDQRGTGKSASAREPVEDLTVERAVADTIEVTEYLVDRFDEEGVYVVGSSWGTTLGVLAVQQRPDLFRAYVGAGQMVDQYETDLLMYAESLDYARRAGDSGFERQLLAIGPPPYTDPLDYPVALSSNPQWQDFTPGEDHEWRASYPVSLFVAEYTLTEQVRSAAALMDTFAVLYPQLAEVDFRRTVPRLEVPVYLVEGAFEATGRSTLAVEWFEMLSAPSKELVVFEHGGHTPHLDDPGTFADLMAGVVEETYRL